MAAISFEKMYGNTAMQHKAIAREVFTNMIGRGHKNWKPIAELSQSHPLYVWLQRPLMSKHVDGMVKNCVPDAINLVSVAQQHGVPNTSLIMNGRHTCEMFTRFGFTHVPVDNRGPKHDHEMATIVYLTNNGTYDDGVRSVIPWSDQDRFRIALHASPKLKLVQPKVNGIALQCGVVIILNKDEKSEHAWSTPKCGALMRVYHKFGKGDGLVRTLTLLKSTFADENDKPMAGSLDRPMIVGFGIWQAKTSESVKRLSAVLRDRGVTPATLSAEADGRVSHGGSSFKKTDAVATVLADVIANKKWQTATQIVGRKIKGT